MRSLDESSWSRRTRCEDWTVQQLIHHLVTADGFWAASLVAAKTGEPSRFLVEFDPTVTPGEFAAALDGSSVADSLALFEQSTAGLLAAADAYEPDDWGLTAESPMGHVPALLALSHAFWDSWVHEFDIRRPLADDRPLELDDLWVATIYSLFAAGIQGGLIDDPAAVGAGPEAPIRSTLSFDEFPDRTVSIEVTDTIAMSTTSADDAGVQTDDEVIDAGSALALIDAFTGRGPEAGDGLPDDLRMHLSRAAEIL